MGDAVILTPALKALKMQQPGIDLHVLVASEIAPLLENIPWIDKVWAMPRKRGKAKLLKSIPFIKALRKEHFDQCIDFGGNDRGALLSLLCGAPIRIGGVNNNKPKFIQRACYSQMVNNKKTDITYFDLHFRLLSACGIKRPQTLALEIACNPLFANAAAELLPDKAIICHIATSQPKKDWPITHWKKLNYLAQQAGLTIVFSSGINNREQQLLADLKTIAPEAKILPPISDLNLFLNVLKISRLVVAGDTGPLHFASGLGVPILGIFAVENSISQIAPIYKKNQIIASTNCSCTEKFASLDYCVQTESCMASIKPEAVFLKLQKILNNNIN